jgi:hypothetical protein
MKPTDEQINIFIKGVLKNLGLTVTPNRLAFFYAWVKSENIDADTNNYLATTWNLYPTKAVGFNKSNWFKNPYFHNWNGGFPVKNYANMNDNIIAASNTLKYGNHYPLLLKGLKADLKPIDIVNNSKLELDIYGTTKRLVTATIKSYENKQVIADRPKGATNTPKSLDLFIYMPIVLFFLIFTIYIYNL